MSNRSIGKRPRSRDELAAWYGEVLADQARSGLGMKAYAAQIGVSSWTLYQWRRRLAKTERPAAPPRVVEVNVAELATGGTPRDFIIRVCEGRRSIAVPPGFDSEGLRRLVATLETC